MQSGWIDFCIRRLKMLKFLLKGILNMEYPRQELRPQVLKFEQELFDKNQESLNCFISWKDTKLTRTHAKEYKNFIKLNKDVRFWFFDDNSQDKWMGENYQSHPIYKIYQGVRFPASKSDIFRLCLLYEYGGIYTGINRVFDGSLRELYSGADKFLISFEKNSFVRQTASNIIPAEFRNLNVVQHTLFAPARHGILRMAMEAIVSHAPNYNKVVFPSVKEAIWKFSAPYLLTHVVDNYLDQFGMKNVAFSGIQYNQTCRIPRGAEFRYATSPSYLGSENRQILDYER